MKWLLGLLAMTLPAVASDELSDQAMRCWNPEPTAMEVGFQATFSVDLSASGDVVGIQAVAYKPGTETEVRRASEAIERCGPYSTGKRTVVVRMTVRPKTPINPLP